MLKYLFTAEYKDGTIYEQSPEDKSINEPDKKSSFYDIDHDNLVGFVIRGEGHTYAVDLRDGHFEVDGVPFFMHETNGGVGYHLEELPNGKQTAMPLVNFKLVYFRRHTHQIEVGVEKNTQKEVAHDMVFKIGWKCEVKCTNRHCRNNHKGVPHTYERVMQIE